MRESYPLFLSRMEERYTALTGFSPDDASDIGIRFKVLANELAGLYEQVQSLQRELFPMTSTGVYLEQHAQTRGLRRKGGAKAVGTLRFSRSTPAGSDLSIPAGTICSTRGEPICRFTTVRDGILPAGEQEIELAATAVEVGQKMNVAAGSVVMMITPVGQITAVTNPLPFTGGTDGEGDEALRERLLESYHVVSNGTNAASYLQKVLGYDGVTSARILPRRRGVGTVDVVLTCSGLEPQESLMNRIREDLRDWKEINVDIVLTSAKAQATDVELLVEPVDGVEFETVKADLTAQVAQLAACAKVGEPLLIARLYSVLMAGAEVKNCHVKKPEADVVVLEDQVITLGNLLIAPMEEHP